MELQTEAGREFHLAARGFGRFFDVGFLLVWLCGWAIGEGLVLWLLVRGAIALLTGAPVAPGGDPLRPGPALAIGAFLVLWLALWSFGGLAALRELIRLTIQRDRLIAGPSSLIVERSFVFFRRRIEISRERLRRIRLVPPRHTLTADTETDSIELSTLGTAKEREEAASALIAELRVEQRDESSSLPGAWREIIDPEGAIAIVGDPRTRRIQARIAAIVALGASLVAAFLIRGSLTDPRQLGLAVMVSAVALACIWGAVRIARSRDEWRCERGRLTLRRRTGGRVRDLFEAVSLELTGTRDSDGDAWYTLDAMAAGAGPKAGKKGRRKLARSMHDPTVPARLGRYLASRTALPFADRTGSDSAKIDLERLKSQLRESGRLGEFAARWIERMESRRAGRGAR